MDNDLLNLILTEIRELRADVYEQIKNIRQEIKENNIPSTTEVNNKVIELSTVISDLKIDVRKLSDFKTYWVALGSIIFLIGTVLLKSVPMFILQWLKLK